MPVFDANLRKFRRQTGYFRGAWSRSGSGRHGSCEQSPPSNLLSITCRRNQNMKLVLLSVVTLACLSACAGSSDSPSVQAGLLGPAKVAVPNSPMFKCEATDGRRDETCDSRTQYCLSTETPNGSASTLSCVNFASAECKDEACLQRHAKSLFPNVENCKHAISFFDVNGKKTVRCHHPYI